MPQKISDLVVKYNKDCSQIKPLVSYCLFTYKQERYISKSVDAALAQTYSPLEIIISDDGSDQETSAVVNKWKELLPIKHIWHEDKGFRKCKILNKSLLASKSEYVVFLDGDCIPHKFFIKDHVKLAQKGFFVQGRRCFVPEKEVPNVINGIKTLRNLFFSGKLSGYFKSIRFPKPIIKINKD